MLLKHRSNAVIIGIRDTSFWTLKCIEKTYRCFFENVQCFSKNVQCFFKNIKCFFQNNGMFFFDYLTCCK